MTSATCAVNGRPEVDVEWSADRTLNPRDLFAPLHRGAGDPSMVFVGTHLVWALHTPDGLAVTVWRVLPDRRSVHLQAWGAGAAWLASRVPAFLGADDDPSGFDPLHPHLRRAHAQPRHADWRVIKTSLVMNSLIPSILEQKVTGKQAFGAYRILVRRFGTPIQLPAGILERVSDARCVQALSRLTAPPSTAQWRQIPSWEWLQAGVEPPQSRTIMRALSVAERLEETCELPITQAHARLRAVPGIGIWTAAKVAQTAWGDADAPTFADYHVAKQVGFALEGRDADDARMAHLLAPFRGHRYRAERLILAVGPHRERHGARMVLPHHLPLRSL